VHESPGRWPAGQAAVRLRNAIISTGLQLHPARHTTGRPALAYVIDGACIPASAGPFLHPSITPSAEWAAWAALDDGGAQAAPWTVTLGSLLHPCPLSVSEAVEVCAGCGAMPACPWAPLHCAAQSVCPALETTGKRQIGGPSLLCPGCLLCCRAGLAGCRQTTLAGAVPYSAATTD
jgi:hypothetical protein